MKKNMLAILVVLAGLCFFINAQADTFTVTRSLAIAAPPEIIFDQPLGSLFTCSVAGNIPTTEMIESLEYAVSFLGVPLLVVMGHSSCGAVTEALLSEYPRGLFSHIALPSVSNLHEAIIYNTKESVKTILDRSPLILDSIESGDLTVTSGVQDIASGKFTVLDCYQVHDQGK